MVDSAHNEKRKFPRLPADCPVLFKLGSEAKWKLGKMMDISATGLSMVCAETIDQGNTVQFQVKPGSNKTIPPIEGTALVIRSIPMENHEFHVCCKLSSVKAQSK